LFDEVSRGFWKEKLGVVPPQPDLGVHRFTPTSLAGTLKEIGAKNAVLVGTIQSLAEVRDGHGAEFSMLVEKVSLLIFDEGHREPARVWGDAARALGCPSVLFSATPYRNDYALFEIDSTFVESLSFHDALVDKCIRAVNITAVAFADAESFVAKLDGVLKKEPLDARAIVRCQTKDAITRVVNALKARGHDAIGIHDGYTATDGAVFRSSVPSPKAEKARVWVHQYKLLEGIDDPRFSIVALHDPFSNARSLVQQVGRVIRNPTRTAGKAALLMVHEAHGQQEYWDRYLEFERFYDPRTPQDVRDLILEAVRTQPKHRYLDGNFRAVFDPTAPGFEQVLRVPRSANVYRLTGAWKPATLQRDIIAEWEQGDRIRLNEAQPDKDTIVVLYADARNSPILLRDYFFEDRLGFTLVHRRGEWVFYLDTGGCLSEAVQDVAAPLSGAEMHRLFGAATRPVAMSMRNTDLGRHAFRYRSVRAYSLAEAATGLSDHGYFCSTVEGYEKSADLSRDIRRYVGVARGRLTETSPQNHDLTAFKKWAASKTAVLATSGDGHAVFDRFAAYVDPPTDPSPRHLLLDVVDLVSSGAYRTLGGEELRIDDLAVHVDEKGMCEIVANDTRYEVSVTYDSDRQRYRLSCDDLDGAYTRGDSTDRFRRGLLQHMNLEQSFRVVPGTGWTIYAHGHFVEPATGVGKSAKKGLDLLRIFTEVPALAVTTSEKGGPGSATTKSGWEQTSVFGVIERSRNARRAPADAVELAKAMAGFDIVICDDMNKETADFISADTKSARVVLTHAKHAESKLSASAFHEVCSQAVKNLGILQPFARAEPPNLGHWDSPWHAYAVDKNKKRVAIGDVKRIRIGGTKGQACWRKISDLLRRPDTDREVWIVLGKTLSLASLEAERKSSTPEPEAVQLFYLLQSTWAAVSAIGARLRIFAS